VDIEKLKLFEEEMKSKIARNSQKIRFQKISSS